MTWIQAGNIITASFIASLVECVEAATIVLAVGAVRGWRSALTGTGLVLASLCALVLVLGPANALVPERVLQLLVGMLLLLFGLRWLRKAILRAAGAIALHDEAAAFRSETANLRLAHISERWSVDPIATATAFKAVLLEGIEVVFIILATAAGGVGLLPVAAAGALAAALLVMGAAVAVRKPLACVPENRLKFAVGALISAFGIYWVGEGIGIDWPGHDLALLGLVAGMVMTGLLGVRLAALGGPAASLDTEMR
jgi:uncharacterized membrane protein